LTCRVPRDIVDNALESKQVVIVDLAHAPEELSVIQSMIRRIERVFQDHCSKSKPLRLCIPSLGWPAWGELSPQVFFYLVR